MSGDQTTTSKTTIPEASGQEKQLLRLLQRLAQSAEGQIGDLSALARGDVSALGPTGQDQELIARSLGFQTDIAKRALESLSAEGQGRLSEELTARGQADSSIESVKRAILERDLGRQVEDLISRQAIEGNQALMNLPFQRANVALGANQALFQQLTGGAVPALQSLLQARMAQPTTTQTQSGGGFGFGDLLNLGMTAGGLLGGLPGMAIGAAGGVAGGAAKAAASTPSLQQGFQSGLQFRP